VPLSGVSVPAIILNRVDLPAPLPPIIPTTEAFWNSHREVVNQHLIAKAFADIIKLNDLVAKAFARGYINFIGFVAGLELLRIQLVKASQSRFAFGLAALGILTHPFQFLLESLLSSGLLLRFGFQTADFAIEPSGIVAFIGNTVTAIQLENPAGDIVEEVAIVSYCNHGAGKFFEEFFQPEYRVCIQVVGGLVEQQHIGLRQQQSAQRNTATFTTGQGGDIRIPGWQAQGICSDIQGVIEIVCIPGFNDFFQLALTFSQSIKIRVGAA